MESVLQDVRYALRMMAKSPVFTAVIVVTLALGIGANTAIFSIVNALMLRPLPVENPSELAVVGDPSRVNSFSTGSPRSDIISFPLYKELLAGNEVFSSLAATASALRAKVTLDSATPVESGEVASVRIVTGNYFTTLGLKPFMGRFFTADEDNKPVGDPVVVLSHEYWKRKFDADEHVIGKTIRVNGASLTVIGVAPPGFVGEVVGQNLQLFVPMMMQPAIMPGRPLLDAPKSSWLLLIGRRKPGISVAQAQAAVRLQIERIEHSGYMANFEQGDRVGLHKPLINVSEGSRGFSSLRSRFREPLALLMAIVCLVLLIACVNVASLLLARSSTRRAEVAVRLALGARFSRIVRQLLTESILLGLFGGAVGVLAAMWAAEFLVRVVTGAKSTLPLDVKPDATVLAFTLGLAVLTGIVFGLVPALRLRNVDLVPALKPSGRSEGISVPRPTLGKALVVAQLALSVLVVITAAVLVRSLLKLQEVDLGYARGNLVMLRADLTGAGYTGPKLPIESQALLEQLRRVPGVQAATFSENGLFSGTESATDVYIDGAKPQGKDAGSNFDDVGPSYFSAIGIPILAGREIGASDTATSARVAVVNQAFANYFFKGRDPIGHQIAVDDDEHRNLPYEIVGISRDARDHAVKDAVEPRFYVPFVQNASLVNGTVNFELRTSGDPEALVEPVRKAIAALDATIPLTGVQTLETSVSSSLQEQIVLAKLSSMFGVLALALACIGLYGVMSYSVAGRTREIGIRMALGAKSGDVLWMVLHEAVMLLVIGIVIGVPLSSAGTHALRSMMFGVSAFDPPSIGSSVFLLLVVGIAAAFLPARRATKVDPMIALRYE
jgi:predicted permease